MSSELDPGASPPVSVLTRPYEKAFNAYAERRTDTLCVTNDLTASCEADGFRRNFPDRYFSLGMAEQNLVGVLAGLAREGFTPFYPTFSVFATRRPYEQIALSVAYPNLPVRFVGFLPGLTTPGGVTHQSIDDIGLMSQLPNMTVIEVGDATEAETVLDVVEAVDGPVFLRMLRGEVPIVFDTPLQFNRARQLSDGEDILIISSGVHTQLVCAVVARLSDAGVGATHLHVSTLKPFTDEFVLEQLTKHRLAITVENHLSRGGLGTATAEMIADHGVGTRLRRVGIDDTYTHGGSRDYLFGYYGIDEAGLLAAVGALLDRPLAIKIDKHRGPSPQRQHHATVAEGL